MKTIRKKVKIIKIDNVERRCKAFHFLQEMATGSWLDVRKAADPEFTKGIAIEYWGGDYDPNTFIFTKTGPQYKYY